MIGTIAGYKNGVLTIEVPVADEYLLTKQDVAQADVFFIDGRLISDFQREAICATCNDIGKWTGNFELERFIQMLTFCELYDHEPFSLSRKSDDCATVSVARAFLTYLISLCVIHGIPCESSLLQRVEDIGNYLYACVANRRCAICGAKADIHEYETVGMGRNRDTIHHLGQAVQPLCRKHHSEVGTIGQLTFDRKYHLTFVRLDESLCKALKWKA